MQVDCMRHHGCAQDTRGQQDAFRTGKLWDKGMVDHCGQGGCTRIVSIT